MTVSTAKKGWTTVAFGDVVKLSKERSSNPEADGLDRFIGLEHLTPGDLKVRRWGNIADGVTFTNVFRPGQVLFGKRRAYQRKVAVAEFSGVCSGDIYVLEPRSNQLLPELLPFICQTDAFFDHAVGTSAGSLSPRTNWKSLADFEFALPPIDEQRQIAVLVQASENAIVSLAILQERIHSAYLSFLASLFSPATDKEPRAGIAESPDGTLWRWHRVDELFSLQLGKMSSKKSREGNNQEEYIKNNNVLWGSFELDDLPKMSFDERERQKYSLEPGDLLVCEGGEIGRSAIWQGVDRDLYYQKALHRLRPLSHKICPTFFMHYLRACAEFGILNRIATGSTILHLPRERLAELRLPFPDYENQLRCANLLKSTQGAMHDAQKRQGLARDLKNQLLAEVLT